MTTTCCVCGKEIPFDNGEYVKCFFCRHKVFLKERGITDCTCYMCLREKGLLTEKVLEESLELTLAHQTEEYVRIKQKWLKRNQRHPEKHINVNQESDREFRELLKQIEQVTVEPLTEQSHFITEQPQPEQPKDYATLRSIRMAKKQLIEDNGEQQGKAVDLW